MAKRKLGRGLDLLISPREKRGALAGREKKTGGEDKSQRPEAPEKKARKRSPRGPATGAEKERLSESAQEQTGAQTRGGEDGVEGGLRLLALDPRQIEVNPDQPRREFSPEDLESLAMSVAKEGILQPLLVRQTPDGYQLVAGERRLRAAREAGLETVPARVVEVEEGRLLEIALVENLHRSDLNPIEVAEAYRHLLEVHDWTQARLAETLGVRRSSVANTLRLLDLPEDMKLALVRGQISTGHAKVLLAASSPEHRRQLFDRIAEDNLSVRELEDERMLQRAKSGEPEEGPSKKRRRRRPPPDKPPYLVSLEEQLAEQLGSRVRIREKKGRGVISIDFYSKEDFERIRSLLLGRSDNLN